MPPFPVRLWLLTLLLLLCCAPVQYEAPIGTRFEPPPEWETAYNEVWEQCGSKMTPSSMTPWNRLEWYAMPTDWFRVGPKWALGYRHYHRLYLGPKARQDPALFVARHEMLHAMIPQGGHPPIFRECHLDAGQYEETPQSTYEGQNAPR